MENNDFKEYVKEFSMMYFDVNTSEERKILHKHNRALLCKWLELNMITYNQYEYCDEVFHQMEIMVITSSNYKRKLEG